MYADISKPPPPLPAPRLSELRPGVHLLRPLSRRGHGPGLVVLTPDSASDNRLGIVEGVPWPLLKWAEEGYAVVEIQTSAVKVDGSGNARDALDAALKALAACEECDGQSKIGLVGKNDSPSSHATKSLTAQRMTLRRGTSSRRLYRTLPRLSPASYTPTTRWHSSRPPFPYCSTWPAALPANARTRLHQSKSTDGPVKALRRTVPARLLRQRRVRRPLAQPHLPQAPRRGPVL